MMVDINIVVIYELTNNIDAVESTYQGEGFIFIFFSDVHIQLVAF